jgi:folate-binding Fe-S cluster repair protein YgfZ
LSDNSPLITLEGVEVEHFLHGIQGSLQELVKNYFSVINP